MPSHGCAKRGLAHTSTPEVSFTVLTAEVPKSQLDALALAAVEYAPAHGYEIIDRLRRRTADVLRVPEGSVYPVLHRLERDGLLKSRWTVVNGRRRRVYRLTRMGQEALAVRRLEWKTFARAINAALTG
jgi:PadR family transcriptional regulator